MVVRPSCLLPTFHFVVLAFHSLHGLFAFCSRLFGRPRLDYTGMLWFYREFLKTKSTVLKHEGTTEDLGHGTISGQV